MKIKIGQEDNGREIELKVGDVLRLELAEHPTTGYRWSVQMPLPASLELVRNEFTRAGGGLGAGGVGSTRSAQRRRGISGSPCI